MFRGMKPAKARMMKAKQSLNRCLPHPPFKFLLVGKPSHGLKVQVMGSRHLEAIKETTIVLF